MEDVTGEQGGAKISTLKPEELCKIEEEKTAENSVNPTQISDLIASQQQYQMTHGEPKPSQKISLFGAMEMEMSTSYHFPASTEHSYDKK